MVFRWRLCWFWADPSATNPSTADCWLQGGGASRCSSCPRCSGHLGQLPDWFICDNPDMALAPSIPRVVVVDRRLWRVRRGQLAVPLPADRRAWAGLFERALSVVLCLTVLNTTVVSIQWFGQTLAVTGWVGLAAMAGAVAALATAALVMVIGMSRPFVVYLTAGTVVAAQFVVALTATDSAALPETWWAWQLMIPTCVLISGLLPVTRAIPVLVLLMGAYAWLRLSPMSGPGHGWHAAISDLSIFVVFSVFVSLWVPAWRRTADVADAAAAASYRSHAATEAARAADRQRRAAARLLHDEVIHSLRAICLPPGAIDRAEVRHMTSQACDLLIRGSSDLGVAVADGLTAALEEVATRSPLIVRVQCSREPTLPDPVVTAIGGAVAEALRNVERHSGVREAVITVMSAPGGVEVDVRDEGAGFDTTRMTGPLGFDSSILGRLMEVGGSATVVSSPGNGTTVKICWVVAHRDDFHDLSQRMAGLAGTRTRLMIGAGLPMLAYTMAQAALNRQLLADPAVAVLVVGFSSVIIVAALLWGRTRPIPALMSFGLIVTALATTTAGGLGLKAGTSVEVAYFAAGAAAPALALLAFFRPHWESLVASIMATAAAVVMVHRMDPGWDTMGRALPAVTSNLVAVVAVLLARLTIDRASRSVLWDEEMERQAESARAQLTIGRQVMADRLGRVRDWVLPFLAGVARGNPDPADPAVRQRAAVLEAAVRDDIRLGAAIDERARTLIADARSTGRQVEINAEPEAAATLPPRLVSRLLIAALDCGDPPRRVVLTISRPSAGPVTVSLLVTPSVPAPNLLTLAVHIGASIVTGPSFSLLRITVDDPGTSPQVGTIAEPLVSVQSQR